MSGYPSPVSNEGWMNVELRRAQLEAQEANRRAMNNITRVRYATIDPAWTFGRPLVRLDGETLYNTATNGWEPSFTPSPGARVSVIREYLTGDYFILGGVRQSNTYLNQLPLPLQGGWVAYDTNDWPTATYSKTSTGIVVLSGLIKGGSVAVNSVVGVLPVGFRPDYAWYGGINQSDVARSISIFPNGEIRVNAGYNTGGYISLAGIAFPAAGVAQWVTVGAAGTGSAFVNSFKNHTRVAEFGPARYWKDSYGMVWLGGLVMRDTAPTADTDIFTIAGLTYKAKRAEHIATQSNDAFGFIGVNTQGFASNTDARVQWKLGSAGSAHVSLDGAVYESSTSTIAWSPVSFQNGWVNYDTASFTPAQYARMADGRVHMHGLIKNGTIGAAAFNVPGGYRTPSGQSNLYGTVSMAARGRADFQPNGNYVPAQGGNGWFSLDSMVYLPQG